MSCVPCPVQGRWERGGHIPHTEHLVGRLWSAGSGAAGDTVCLAVSAQMPLSVFQRLPPPGRGLLPPGLMWRGSLGPFPWGIVQMEGWFLVVAFIGGRSPGELGVQQCSGMFTQQSIIPHVTRLADTLPTQRTSSRSYQLLMQH